MGRNKNKFNKSIINKCLLISPSCKDHLQTYSVNLLTFTLPFFLSVFKARASLVWYQGSKRMWWSIQERDTNKINK
jgi:hypothetical protein